MKILVVFDVHTTVTNASPTEGFVEEEIYQQYKRDPNISLTNLQLTEKDDRRLPIPGRKFGITIEYETGDMTFSDLSNLKRTSRDTVKKSFPGIVTVTLVLFKIKNVPNP